jgi:hypothetical protein
MLSNDNNSWWDSTQFVKSGILARSNSPERNRSWPIGQGYWRCSFSPGTWLWHVELHRQLVQFERSVFVARLQGYTARHWGSLPVCCHPNDYRIDRTRPWTNHISSFPCCSRSEEVSTDNKGAEHRFHFLSFALSLFYSTIKTKIHHWRSEAKLCMRDISVKKPSS